MPAPNKWRSGLLTHRSWQKVTDDAIGIPHANLDVIEILDARHVSTPRHGSNLAVRLCQLAFLIENASSREECFSLRFGLRHPLESSVNSLKLLLHGRTRTD